MSQLQTGYESADLQFAVGKRIEHFFAGRITASEPLGAEYRHLWESARTASMGGKRLRPAFVVGTYRALGGTDDAAAVELATAFELLHTAFLLHDDVIDRDTVRRGIPNLAGEFAGDALACGTASAPAELWGHAAAILAGDLLIHYSQGMVARLSVADATRSALLDVLDKSMFVTAAGELSDVAFSVGMSEARLPDVLAMTERKTAAYSFEGPLTAGAILAGASTEVLDVLGEYGRLLGVAFQLGDDLLGLFGTEEFTGKSVVNDLREGKETLLMAYARTTSEWYVIAESFGDPEVSDFAADRARAALERCGARSFVEGLVADFSDRASEISQSSLLPASLRHSLSESARHCVGRLT